MKRGIKLLSLLIFLAASSQAMGGDLESRVQAMEETLKRQQKTIEEQQKIIEELKDQIKTQITAEKPKTAVATTEPETQKPGGTTGLFGGSALSNPNISLVFNDNK